jgi:signal peptidase I
MSDPADPGPGDGPGPDDAAEPGQEGKQARRRWQRVLIEAAVIAIVAALLAFLVRTYAFESFSIPSSSMEPTLGIGDRIEVQKAFADSERAASLPGTTGRLLRAGRLPV